MDRFQLLREQLGYGALTPAGRKLLESVLSNAPTRPVGRSSLLSVSGTHISTKFSVPVEYESRGCEKAYVLLAEWDTKVLEVFSQPARLPFLEHDCRGRRRPVRRTPDYLECGTDAFALVECKPREQLEELALRSNDWIREDSGRWRFLPGEEAATRFGMAFRVFCPDSYPPAWIANLEMANRSKNGVQPPSTALLRRIRLHLQRHPQTVMQLCERFADLTGGSLWAAIQRGQLFGFVDRQLFDQSFLVYVSKPAEAHGFSTGRDGCPGDQPGPLASRLALASSSEHEKAMKACKRFDDRRLHRLPMDATDYRYKRRLIAATTEGAPRLAAFVPRFKERGGRGKRISEEVSAAMASHASEYLRTGGLPIGTRQYADFTVRAEQLGLPCPSAETYRQHVLKELAPERAAFLSGGKRAFHAQRPRTDGAKATPRPLIAGLKIHIDGVYGDVKSRPDEDGLYLRPIIYPMVDDATGYVLARGVKVGRPNARAVAMAFRDCYLRHGMLPAQIITDWGSEFVNHLVADMCLYFGVGEERRPVGAPRFGGRGEMLNAGLSTFLQSLAGGTYFDKAGRSADGDKKSLRTAAHSITDLVHAADHWMFEIWNRSPCGPSGESPEQLWLASRKCFPEAVVATQDNGWARYHTSLPLKNLSYDYVRGMKYAGRYYASEKAPDFMRSREKLSEPRLDCVDPSTLHVLSERGPIELHSMQYQRTRALGDAQSMEEMHRVLAARSVARINQHNRNIKEARHIREMSSVLPALAVSSAPDFIDIHDSGHHPDPAVSDNWDISDIQDASLPALDAVEVGGRLYDVARS